MADLTFISWTTDTCWTTDTQSCQPLCFGCSLLRSRALHYAVRLMTISLLSPSEKQFIFGGGSHACVWACFNQLTNHSVWFNSCSYASLPGEMTSVFSHFKSPCWSEKLKASSRVMNLVKKTAHQNFQEEHYTETFLCVVRSTWSAKHVKCSACFFSSWDSSVAHGGMYNVKQCVNSKHHINKRKAIGSTLKISH